MKFFRALADPGDVKLPLDGEPEKSCKDLAEDMAYEVVNALVSYAAGFEREGKKGPYFFYPYGKPAATSTASFKKLPDAWFAVTLASMYPFVLREYQKWDAIKKKFAHPMTGLWPWGTVNRHLCIRERFTANRESLFAAYERKGGDYHGQDKEVAAVAVKRGKRSRRQNKSAVESDEDTDSMDDVFHI